MKIFAVFGFVLIAIIVAASVIFTQGMYSNIAGESNQTNVNSNPLTPDNESAMQYEIQYAWQVMIGLFATVAAIIAVIWLFVR